MTRKSLSMTKMTMKRTEVMKRKKMVIWKTSEEQQEIHSSPGERDWNLC